MKTRVVQKKLGRQRVLGFAWSDGLIEIDPRQSSKEFLDTLLHELLHCHFQDLSEEDVTRIANDMSNKAWRFGYRRIME